MAERDTQPSEQHYTFVDRENLKEYYPLNRRELLKAAGAAGAAGLTGLAGCTSDGENPDNETEGGDKTNNDGGGDDGTTPSGELEMVDRTFLSGIWEVPKELQFNPYNPTKYSSNLDKHLFEPWAKWDYDDTQFEPFLVQEWNFDGKVITLNTREQKWHNGEPLDARDLYTQLLMDKHFGSQLWNYVESVENPDNTTIKLQMDKPYNPGIITPFLLMNRANTPAFRFNEYVDKLENAESDEEKEEIKQEVTELRIEEPIANGPWKFIEKNTQRFVTERWDEYRIADQINFPRFEFIQLATQESRWQALKSNKLDGLADSEAPDNVKQGFPDSVVEVPFQYYAGTAIALNHAHPDLGNRKVRQALAYVLDRPSISQNIGGSLITPLTYPTPVPMSLYEQYGINDEFMEYNASTQKATSLLESAGYTKKNGSWHTPEGEKMNLPIVCASGLAFWVNAGQTIAQQLKSFGIESQLNTVEWGSWVDSINRGDFTMSLYWDGLASWPTPYFHLDFTIGTSEFARHDMSYSPTVEVPPVGKPDGEPQTVDLEKKLEELALADGEKAATLTREIAWAVNYDLPRLCISQKTSHSWLTDDDWIIPPVDSDRMRIYPVYQLPRFGELKAKPK